jgi:hypothetical protein
MTARSRSIAGIVVGALLVATLSACGGGDDQTRAASTSSTVARTAPTTTTTTAPPTTTTTAGPPPPGPVANPWPVIGPAPAGHHAILTMGDSIMGQSTFALGSVLASHGFDAVVYDAHVNASGLLDPMNGVSARELLAQQLAAHPDVDTVLFEWLNVCAYGCADGDPAYGTPAFYAAWQDVVRSLVSDVRARGLRVLWAIPPPPPPAPDVPPAESWDNPPMRVAVATQLAATVRTYPETLGIPVIDWWTALSDTQGQFQATLWYDGALHDVRTFDGVHITDDGSVRASTWAVAALAQLYGA